MPLWQSINIGQVSANFKQNISVSDQLVKSGIGASLTCIYHNYNHTNVNIYVCINYVATDNIATVASYIALLL